MDDLFPFPVGLPGWLPSFQHNAAVEAYLTILVFDIIFGTLRAWKERRLNSTIARDGMVAKASMILLVALAMLLERYTDGIPISKVVAFCFSGAEIISIAENAQALGVKGMDVLGPYLEKVVTGKQNRSD